MLNFLRPLKSAISLPAKIVFIITYLIRLAFVIHWTYSLTGTFFLPIMHWGLIILGPILTAFIVAIVFDFFYKLLWVKHKSNLR